eukprot:10714050-Heterocapsa_arctica.AAC.1
MGRQRRMLNLRGRPGDPRALASSVPKDGRGPLLGCHQPAAEHSAPNLLLPPPLQRHVQRKRPRAVARQDRRQPRAEDHRDQLRPRLRQGVRLGQHGRDHPDQEG